MPECQPFEEVMGSLGWYKQKHTLPIKKKHEFRYHKNGSEITEKEAMSIFSGRLNAETDFMRFMRYGGAYSFRTGKLMFKEEVHKIDEK